MLKHEDQYKMLNKNAQLYMPQKSSFTRRFWSEYERSLMEKMYSDNYTDTICKIINRSRMSVYNQANSMGLKKSDAFYQMDKQRKSDILRIVGIKSRFQEGREPKNKGKSMPKEVYEKVKKTMFKKGNQPSNTKYDGHESITNEGYIQIRIRKGKYVLKHRLIWEQANGKIPNGHIVVFRDKNPNNIVLENLELISRKENMQRNTIHRFPEEIKSTIRLFNKLKRTINEKQD